MLSLNIFPLARIQIGILIRHLDFEHGSNRYKATLGSLAIVMLLQADLLPGRAQLQLILHKTSKTHQARYGITKKVFQIPFVGSVWTVEEAPFSTYEVKGVHQVGATQVLRRG